MNSKLRICSLSLLSTKSFNLQSMNTFVNLHSSKNFTFLLLNILICLSINAQNKSTQDSLINQQEIRLDLFQLIILPGIDASYERFIDNVSSWGVTAFINFDNEFSEAYRFQHFEISPYYRLYFKRKNARNSGFFVQPFISLTSGEYDYYPDNYNDYSSNNNGVKDFLGFAGGALIGQNGSIKNDTPLKLTQV